MEKIFTYNNYKSYIKDHISSSPRGGHGIAKAIAKHLRAHSSHVSQVLNSDRHFTHEQGFDLCGFFSLTDEEKDYFMLLLNYEKAGSFKLQKYYKKKMIEKQKQALEIFKQMPQHTTITDREKRRFYSQWYYSAVRLMAGISKYNNVDDFLNSVKLPRSTVVEVVEFLQKHGLIIREENGGLNMGPAVTHEKRGSESAINHHCNWRLKAIERYSNYSEEELSFTAPLTIRKNDIKKVYELLTNTVGNIGEIVKDSEPEQLCCLNIDWFFPLEK